MTNTAVTKTSIYFNLSSSLAVYSDTDGCWTYCFSGSFHTGVNFIEKSESGAMVRFVRVTYVRRSLDDSTDTPSTTANDYSPPKGFSYKTFVPSPVKVAMCSGAPVYESFASTWERARVWLRLVGQLQRLRPAPYFHLAFSYTFVFQSFLILKHIVSLFR